MRSATASLISRCGSIAAREFDQCFQDLQQVSMPKPPDKAARSVETRHCAHPVLLEQNGGVIIRSIDAGEPPEAPMGRLELIHIQGAVGDGQFQPLAYGNAEILSSVHCGEAFHVMAHLPTDKDVVGVRFEGKGGTFVAMNHPDLPAIQAHHDFEKWTKRKRLKPKVD